MERQVEQREERTSERRSALNLEGWDALNRSIRVRRDLRRASAEMRSPDHRVAMAARRRALALLDELVAADVPLVALDAHRRAACGGGL